MDISQLLQSCREKLTVLEEIIPLQQHRQRLSEIDQLLNSPDLWNNPRGAAGIMKERTKLSELLKTLSQFKDQVQYYSELSDLDVTEVEKEGTNIFILHSQLSDLEFKQMLREPVDDSAAILSINAGAGGLEAANWVSMLLRMYVRYANDHGYQVEMLDEKRSEEHSAICIDAVAIRVEGPYAYGFLKGETGVHRLIRNSPFNAADARQTSFAAVMVTPDIEDTIDIKIEEKDIEITAQTSSGSGGQNINKVASAIRLKHAPSGINILVRTERDQLANKKIALKMLKSKLYDIELKKKQQEKDKLVASYSDISFGHQVRTYTLSPYTLVKDHRTNYERNDADNVLDGDIHDFTLSYLRRQK